MKHRTLAVAGSIAALSLAAAPVAAASSAVHHGAKVEARADRSLDSGGVRHTDKSPDRASKPDRSSPDRSPDLRDR